MARIKKQLTELIGGTPLLELSRFSKKQGAKAQVIAKLEYFNPGGSVKDRIALAMIEDAESKGILKPGSVIIEPTSGNTGVGLAWVARVKGYKTILTMPETMSLERRNLLKAAGAQLVLTEGGKGMKGAIEKAEELRKTTPGAVILGQFDNPANPAVHVRTTAREIWGDTDGIGAGFIPKIYNGSLVDKIIRVKDDDAIRTGRELSSTEGLLVGISSGAAAYAALELAKLPENEGKQIVVLLPDTGERYLSTVLYAFEEYPLPNNH